MMRTPHSQLGFSLIELLVSLSIFTIVITMSVGTLLVLIDANSKAQSMQSAFTNVMFALDSMTREIRTGTRYVCDQEANPPALNLNATAVQDCASVSANNNLIAIVEGGSSLSGGTATGRIYYYYDDAYVEGGTTRGAILRKIGNSTDVGFQDWTPITSRDIDIQSFSMAVSGTTVADGDQPSVFITLQGEAGTLNTVDSSFTLQTYIAQRFIDI